MIDAAPILPPTATLRFDAPYMLMRLDYRGGTWWMFNATQEKIDNLSRWRDAEVDGETDLNWVRGRGCNRCENRQPCMMHGTLEGAVMT